MKWKSPFWIVWNQKLGREECPYMRRWAISFGLFSIRLHHWYYGDDPRNFHDHQWNFLIWVLKGGYNDVSPEGVSRMDRWQVQYRNAEHQHTVDVDKGGCWTLCITGPVIRQWGFWVTKKDGSGTEAFKKPNKYFIENGHHPCQD